MLKKYGNIIQEQEQIGFIEKVDESAELKKNITTFLIILYRRNQALCLSELFTTAVVDSRIIRQV